MSISEYTIRNCIFGFKCNASWEDMRIIKPGGEDGDVGGIRFCNTCQKEVFECTDDYELIEHVRLNRCITFMNEDLSIPRLTGAIVRL